MVIQDTQALTALQTVEDVLVNNIMASNFRIPMIVDFGLTVSAAGPVVDVKVGLNFVATNIKPSLQNRYPIFPDDYIGSFGVLPGDRILMKVVETSNNARSLFYVFRFRPAVRR